VTRWAGQGWGGTKQRGEGVLKGRGEKEITGSVWESKLLCWVTASQEEEQLILKIINFIEPEQ